MFLASPKKNLIEKKDIGYSVKVTNITCSKDGWKFSGRTKATDGNLIANISSNDDPTNLILDFQDSTKSIKI